MVLHSGIITTMIHTYSLTSISLPCLYARALLSGIWLVLQEGGALWEPMMGRTGGSYRRPYRQQAILSVFLARCHLSRAARSILRHSLGQVTITVVTSLQYRDPAHPPRKRNNDEHLYLSK
jgi:hypothetical protein